MSAVMTPPPPAYEELTCGRQIYLYLFISHFCICTGDPACLKAHSRKRMPLYLWLP